jgi:hypothetical protein
MNRSTCICRLSVCWLWISFVKGVFPQVEVRLFSGIGHRWLSTIPGNRLSLDIQPGPDKHSFIHDVIWS